ncbi:hypothetical protein LCGC14_0626080 [marine sediment metagenome]|uniref:Uncharacterized protein n=1 Tax=marine sediment metagenome TaxID=412755 RepID=A0A0F9UBU1_9ZZZZ
MTREYMWNVIDIEGGFVDDPDDRGGMTNRGITWGLYDRYCLSAGYTPDEDEFKRMDDVLTEAIYVWAFITPLQINKIASNLTKEAIFDAAVLHGGWRAMRMAQRVIGGLKIDGRIGPITRKALNGAPPVSFANDLAIRRVLFVDRLVQRYPKQVKYLAGWHTRIVRFIRPTLAESDGGS